MRPRPILHVSIREGSGPEWVELADVDAASTADALAYYLRSRRIDEAATEASVAAEAEPLKRLAPRARIVREERHPITGVLIRCLVAEATT